MLRSIIQHRRGTTSEWMVSNIIPEDGELIIEECSDGVRKFKFGDGIRLFKDLPYATSGADGLVYVDNLLQLTANGVPIGNKVEITGGSGSSTSVIIKNVDQALTFAAATTVPTYLKFSFTSVLPNGEETGDCMCTVSINGSVEYYSTIKQGYNEVEISKFLKVGQNVVELTCTDSYGNSRYLSYGITGVELKVKKSTTFNANKVYNDVIRVEYIPIGQGISKKVHFVVDGKEVGTDTVTSSGRTLSYDLPKQPHGKRTLEIYLTATINGEKVTSNIITYELLCEVTGRDEAILSSVYEGEVSITQGDLISIPYNIWDRNDLTPSVEFIISSMVDGKEKVYSSTILDVPRGVQSWQTRTYPAGEVFFTIKYAYDLYGEPAVISKTHKFNVQEVRVDVEATTDRLQLLLTAAGRDNRETNPATWTYGTGDNAITTTFTGFNWESNGWITNDGVTCLRLTGDARATIHLNLFKEDFKEYGKTIEFEYAVRDVNNRDAVVIECFADNKGFKATADTAFLQSSGSLIKCNYKDNERVRVTITVDSIKNALIYDEKTASNREISYGFISIYVNGILSGCQVYTDTDGFSQNNPVEISLGSEYCGLDLYTVRSYTKALSIPEVLENFIADISDPTEKVNQYVENDLIYLPGDFDDSDPEADNFIDNISLDKVLKQGKIPVIVFTGAMPAYKDDKRVVSMDFINPLDPDRSFSKVYGGPIQVEIDVQGTSSQYYVRKNWKIKLEKKAKDEHGNTLKDANGKTVYEFKNAAYQHMAGEVPAKVFCIKVDYAEATGTHNTGAAMFVEKLYDRSKVLLPAQVDDPRVRTTIAGFPVLIFEKATEDSIPVFASKGNFNFDKGAEDAFGFTEDYDVECWEFCNNTSDAVNFLSTVPVDWSNDFEPRYVPESAKWDDIEKLLEQRDNAKKGIGSWDDLSINQGVKLRNLMTACVTNFAEMVAWVNSTATYRIENGRKVDITPTELPTPVTYDGITYEEDNKAYRLAKFKAEFGNYFNLYYTSIYYVFTFFALMVDQRAKNLFLTRWRDGTAPDGSPIYHWYPYFYDNDTIFGINNEGQLVFDYYHEDIDQHGTANVYNGQNSILWNNFRECFSSEIQSAYTTLRQKDANGIAKLSYETIIDQFITNGSDKYAAIIYNEDADYKYMSMAHPNEEGVIDTTNLYQVRGPGDNHLKYFIDNRIKYCDSKWSAGEYPANYATFRLYTPTIADITEEDSPETAAAKEEANRRVAASIAAVPAHSNITIKPYSLMYAGARYGAASAVLQERLQSHAETYTFSAPLQENGQTQHFNDTETTVFPASEISSFGDLSGLYCGYVDVQKATKLVELIVGSENPAYYNANFYGISVGANRLLRKLDLRNCQGLGIAGKDPQKTLLLDGCPNLEEVYLDGTNLDAVKLPNNGYLRKLSLPTSVSTINIKGQIYLETKDFKLDSFKNVKKLCIDNCPKLDTSEILNRCKDEHGNWTVERVRLTDINWSFDDITFVNSLFTLKGLDENNFEQDNAYLEGTCHIKKLSGNEYAAIKSRYPHLTITFEELDSQIIFMSADGKTELYRKTVYNGGSLKRDPVMTGDIAIPPTRESTAKYHYHYAGWTRLFDPIDIDDPDRANPPQANALIEILGDRILYPAFENELRSYDVEFYNPSRTGNVHLQTVKTYYGSAATYTLSEPTKLDVVNAGDYQFTGWYPPIDCITGPHKCYAQYTLLDSAWYKIKPEDVYCEILDDKSVRISAYNNTSKAIVRVPETFTIEGKTYNITEIGSSCFQSSSIEYVKLPETVTTICDWAFNNCQKLMTLELPESLRVIGSRAFTQCSLLESIRIPRNVYSIAPQSFCESASLTTIEVEPGNEYYHVTDGCLIETQTKVLLASVPTAVIPDDGSVTTIAEYAFASSMIESITIPDTITAIGSNAFSSCLNITEVVIPDGCVISSTAFAWCPNLSRVTLPIDLEHIWTYAFHQCPIEHLIIPRKVKEISDHAFADNSSLKTLDFWNIDGTRVDPQAFLNSGHEDGLTINVPWQEGAIAYIPWGADNATINYKVAPPEIDED